jgi:hypothetical protein
VIFLAAIVDVDLAGAGHAGSAHAASHDSRVRRHAAARGQDALGRFHAVDVVRRGFGADQDDGFALLGLFHCMIGGEDNLADGGAGRGGQTGGQQLQPAGRFRIEHRVQELVELVRMNPHHGGLLVDQALFAHFHRDANRGRAGALTAAGLQHVKLAVLDGELEILHVLVVLLETVGDLAQLFVRLRQNLLEVVDRLRRAHAGDHIFALGVEQVLAVEVVFAGGRVAGEAHASAGGIAQVAEHHRLHVDGGAEIARDVVHAAVVVRARVVPRPEHGVARQAHCSSESVGNDLPDAVHHQLLELADDVLPVLGRHLRVELIAFFGLDLAQALFEVVLGNIEHHVAEHLDEAAVGVVGEARVAGPLGQTLDGLVVEAQVEDRVHHARHRELRAGTHAEQQRVLDVAELLAGQLFHLGDVLQHLLVDLVGRLAVFKVEQAGVGGDREAGGTGTPARLISARLAPLPPSVSRMVRSPSAVPPPKAYTCLAIVNRSPSF